MPEDIIEPKPPETGDMYRCEKCDLELQITKPCECDAECMDLQCCGEKLKKVTEPEVMNP
ncbi:hypothetical protein [Adhaeretor mobilis]|nr:hypothetical protein [Adhaeretor mobilis]